MTAGVWSTFSWLKVWQFDYHSDVHLEGHQGAIDDILGLEERPLDQPLKRWIFIIDSETPQDTSSIPLKGRGRNPRIHHDTTIQKLSNCSMVDCQERVTPRGKIEVSQGKSRPADPPWLPNSCWPSSDANIARPPTPTAHHKKNKKKKSNESNHNNNKNKNNNPNNPHNCNNHNNHNNNHKYAAYYGHYQSYDYHCITTWLPRCPAKGGVDMPPMPLMILGTGW